MRQKILISLVGAVVLLSGCGQEATVASADKEIANKTDAQTSKQVAEKAEKQAATAEKQAAEVKKQAAEVKKQIAEVKKHTAKAERQIIKSKAYIATTEKQTATGKIDTALMARLKTQLNAYKKCYVQSDYACMSKTILPSNLKQVGGVQGFVKIMQDLHATLDQQQFVMKLDEMTFGKPSKIVRLKDYAISVIATDLPISTPQVSGTMQGSIIALSLNKGATWFFLEGSEAGKNIVVDNASAELLAKVNVPAGMMQLGDMVLIQKNGQWVAQ